MNYTAYYTDLIDRVYATEKAADTRVVERIRSILPHLSVDIVPDKESIPEIHRNAGTLYLTHPLGEIVTRCPGSRGHICCNYLTVDLYSGCTLGCSYCIMQWYLNFEPISVVVETAAIVARIRHIGAQNRDHTIRIGTGEIGDSLLFDPLCDLSRDFIEGLADCKNISFELKTKTGFVDHLLDIENKGNTVIAFSLNPDTLAKEEEPHAATLDERFKAAEKTVSAGYNLAFHFDPIIDIPDFETHYFPLIDRISQFPQERVVWISLGTFRYPKELRHTLKERPYMFGEYIKSDDGKFRLLQVKRIGIYRKMVAKIKKAGIQAPVYLCMESAAVWRGVFNALPQYVSGTDALFRRPRGV